MKRLAWVTDIHLNFIEDREVDAFCRTIAAAEPDALLISGDIAESDTLEKYLVQLEEGLHIPIHFVLGNHDFYRGSIPAVRASVERLCRRSSYLGWLPSSGVVEISSGTALVGHDGWGDGRLGDYAGSSVLLNDYFLIKELAFDSSGGAAPSPGMRAREPVRPGADRLAELGWLDPGARLERLHALGDEAAAHFREVLPRAFQTFRRVLVLTHAPPFKESCWHEGRISSDEWLPHLTCKATGDVLVEVMRARPDREMTVLCGHTHGAGQTTILPNLTVLTGGATYGAPALQPLLLVE